MTREEALAIIISRKLHQFPKEYRSKEFILKFIIEWECGNYITLWDIKYLGVKVDYDIVLAKTITKRWLPKSYLNYLTEEETSKLKTTLNMLSQ